LNNGILFDVLQMQPKGTNKAEIPNNYSDMLRRYSQPAQGRILISEPTLKDFYFSRSVVLLAEHSTEAGAQGLILNKPLNLKLNEIVKDFPRTEFPVYLGGPVHPDRLF